MKRDMNYIRELLLKIEDVPRPIEESKALLASSATSDEIRKLHYHLQMMIDQAGLVHGLASHYLSGDEDDDGLRWFDLKFTWRGHEFLDTVRDDRIWGKRRKRVRRRSAAWVST